MKTHCLNSETCAENRLGRQAARVFGQGVGRWEELVPLMKAVFPRHRRGSPGRGSYWGAHTQSSQFLQETCGELPISKQMKPEQSLALKLHMNQLKLRCPVSFRESSARGLPDPGPAAQGEPAG